VMVMARGFLLNRYSEATAPSDGQDVRSADVATDHLP
jgi:hypothetical protein